MKLSSIVLLACMFAVCVSAAGAEAQTSRIYFAGYLGLTTTGEVEYNDRASPAAGDLEIKNAPVLAGALGLRINRNVRTELELSVRKKDVNSLDLTGVDEVKMGGELKTTAVMINLYYDFDWNWRDIHPFLTAGAGISFHDGEFDDTSGLSRDASDHDRGLAWQLGGGVLYRIREEMAFTGGYRYMTTSDLDFQSTEIDWSSHEFRLGVQYDIPVDSLR